MHLSMPALHTLLLSSVAAAKVQERPHLSADPAVNRARPPGCIPISLFQAATAC